MLFAAAAISPLGPFCEMKAADAESNPISQKEIYAEVM